MSQEHPDCHIDISPGGTSCEFVAYAWPPAAQVAPHWPISPGAVRFGSDGRPELLHFAPGRWLAPGVSPAQVTDWCESADAPAGSLVDVSGKWDAVQVHGIAAARLLASTIDVEQALDQRDCAAVTLFDCPAILARAPNGYLLWVQSSYTSDFLTAATRTRTLLEGRS